MKKFAICLLAYSCSRNNQSLKSTSDKVSRLSFPDSTIIYLKDKASIALFNGDGIVIRGSGEFSIEKTSKVSNLFVVTTFGGISCRHAVYLDMRDNVKDSSTIVSVVSGMATIYYQDTSLLLKKNEMFTFYKGHPLIQTPNKYVNVL